MFSALDDKKTKRTMDRIKKHTDDYFVFLSFFTSSGANHEKFVLMMVLEERPWGLLTLRGLPL